MLKALAEAISPTESIQTSIGDIGTTKTFLRP
jgi:hypothetical protein